MKKSLWASIILIFVPFLALAISATSMVSAVQEDVRSMAAQHLLKVAFLCESVIHEAGYARIVVGIIGFLILFIPYRERELWSWLALAILLVFYFVPTFVIPFTHPFPGWRLLGEGILHSGAPRTVLLSFLLPGLILIGLAISASSFFGRRIS